VRFYINKPINVMKITSETIAKFILKTALKICITLLILRGVSACTHTPVSVMIEPPIIVEAPDSCGLKKLSFKKDIEPLVTSACVSSVCHNNGNGQRGIGLEGYFNISSFVKDDSTRFLGVIRHQPNFSQMPLGRPKLDSCSIQKLETWIRQGAPNS
jgi:hypothetical protein